MKNFILTAVIVSFGAFPSVARAAVDDASRMDLINQTLDCMSDHSEQSGVDWNDVCFTQPIENRHEDSRLAIMDKSMDEVAREHEDMADEMLAEPVIPHDQESSPKSIDEVYQEHQRENASVKDLDDVVRKHRDQEALLLASAGADSSESAHSSNDAQDRGADEEFKIMNNVAMDSRFASFHRDAQQNKNSSEIGFEFTRFRYVEPVFDLLDKGNFYGAYLNFTARPSKQEAMFEEVIDMYKADIRFSYGKVDYKSAPSGTMKGITDWTLEARILAGKDYVVREDLRLTPYLGFGYRYLNDDSSGHTTSVGHLGYERESRYFYVPLGVELTVRAAHGWLVSPTFEYDVLIEGKQVSHLSDVDPGLPAVRNKQRQGFGVRGSLKFMKIADPVSLVIEPYIRHWNVKDSDEATVAGPLYVVTGLEPKNKTTEYGVRIGAMF